MGFQLRSSGQSGLPTAARGSDKEMPERCHVQLRTDSRILDRCLHQPQCRNEKDIGCITHIEEIRWWNDRAGADRGEEDQSV